MSESDQSFIGQCPELARTLHAAQLVAMTDAPVIVTGENGSGRTMLAKQIHQSSVRRNEGFVVVNCVGIDSIEPLLEASMGADAGTLVIGDIEALDLDLQAGLLRFLDGARQRIIATASDRIAELVRQGRFREDLYFHLNVVPLTLSPLRERAADIPVLLKYFTRRYASRYQRNAPEYSTIAKQVLKSYHWPGNIRELRNFCERMTILLPGRTVERENLPAEIIASAPRSSRGSIFTLPDSGIDLEQVELDLIRQAIETAGGNRSKAARLLGISRDTLNYRIKKYAL